LNLLDNEAWEIRALSSTALKNYKSEVVKNKLKESIKDHVWYVRQNSAKSLYSLIEDESELLNIINGQDKYACDAMKSVMSENDKEKYNFVQRIAKVHNESDLFEDENIKEGQLVGSLQC
ncbi:MAG: HEAT repeat domain-containing protein, partial [Peptostreptococcaceae bacterium]